MQALYYDPVIGRFYSNAPVGFKEVSNFNRYAYVGNNPYKYTDPDGRDRESMMARRFAPMLQAVGNALGSKGLVRVGAKIELDGKTMQAALVGDTKGFRAALSEYKGAVGVYQLKTEKGKTYDGKGTPQRALDSAKEKNTSTDPIVGANFQTTSPSNSPVANRDAFKLEASNLYKNGGAKSESTLNKIDSPGTKKIEEDKL